VHLHRCLDARLLTFLYAPVLLFLQALPQPGMLLRGKAVPDTTSINSIDQVSKVRQAPSRHKLE
jgi:hypothetical protein